MNRIRKLLEQMGAGVYERDHVLALALLSAVAGESLFLLGLPGVGKSLVARRLKLAFRDARAFEYLMSRFSTPDEIFGPVSISKLKDCDTYERLTDGYLPSADIVFLDEIWKAGPSIQNALLTVLNEKLFRNGEHEMQLPLKGIIAASNELPARDEGLEALWDRILLRLVVPPLESEEAFARMITGTTAPTAEVEATLRITPTEYASWQPAIDWVEVGGAILAMIARIRALLKKGIPTGEAQEAAPIYVSDRRWKKIVRLLRTAAFLNGREEVDPLDGFLIGAAVWNEAEQIEPCTAAIDRAVAASIAEPFEREFTQLGERWQAVRGTQPAVRVALPHHRQPLLQPGRLCRGRRAHRHRGVQCPAAPRRGAGGPFGSGTCGRVHPLDRSCPTDDAYGIRFADQEQGGDSNRRRDLSAGASEGSGAAQNLSRSSAAARCARRRAEDFGRPHRSVFPHGTRTETPLAVRERRAVQIAQGRTGTPDAPHPQDA